MVSDALIDVSVIIVNYNTKVLTTQCIESLLSHTEGIIYEIIVVDNASIDGSVEFLSSKFQELRIIRNYINLGFGNANNLGAFNAKASKYLFFLNSDTILLNNAIKVFYDYMELQENRNVGCCGGNLYNLKNEIVLTHGNFPSIFQLWFEFGPHIIFRKYYIERISVGCMNKSEIPLEVDYITGADLFVRRNIFEQLNGFDKDFFMYYEETELCFRIMKLGFINMIIPEAKIIHLEGGSLSHINKSKMEMIEKSRRLFFKKSYGQIVALLSESLRLIRNSIKPYY